MVKLARRRTHVQMKSARCQGHQLGLTGRHLKPLYMLLLEPVKLLIQKTFDALDTDHDGHIGQEEIIIRSAVNGDITHDDIWNKLARFFNRFYKHQRIEVEEFGRGLVFTVMNQTLTAPASFPCFRSLLHWLSIQVNTKVVSLAETLLDQALVPLRDEDKVALDSTLAALYADPTLDVVQRTHIQALELWISHTSQLFLQEAYSILDDDNNGSITCNDFKQCQPGLYERLIACFPHHSMDDTIDLEELSQGFMGIVMAGPPPALPAASARVVEFCRRIQEHADLHLDTEANALLSAAGRVNTHQMRMLKAAKQLVPFETIALIEHAWLVLDEACVDAITIDVLRRFDSDVTQKMVAYLDAVPGGKHDGTITLEQFQDGFVLLALQEAQLQPRNAMKLDAGLLTLQTEMSDYIKLQAERLLLDVVSSHRPAPAVPPDTSTDSL